MEKVQTDFIAIVVQAQETHGYDEKRTRVELCTALKREISRLRSEDIEPYLKSADVNTVDCNIEITLAFPIQDNNLSPSE